MKLYEIERHNFIDGGYTDSSRRKYLELMKKRDLIRKQFELKDTPIICIPELLEENIEKIKLWYQNGGKVKQYSNIEPFKCGLSVVTLKDLINERYYEVIDKIGVINKEGTEVVRCSSCFKDILILNENIYRVQNKDGSYSLYSIINGKEITPFRLSYIDNKYYDGLLIGLVNSPNVDYGVPQTNQYVYFDSNGKIVMTSNKYSSMGQFKNGLALALEEKCISNWLSFPIFDYENTYEYYEYLIDKKGNVIQNLGFVKKATSRDYLNALEPNDRVKGGKIFQADSYYQLNNKLNDNLKFNNEITSASSVNKEDTESVRQYILNNTYNFEKEMNKTIELITYYTEHWEDIISYIEYNDNGTVKTIHRKKVPYIYYLNRDNFALDLDYIPSNKKILTKESDY